MSQKHLLRPEFSKAPNLKNNQVCSCVANRPPLEILILILLRILQVDLVKKPLKFRMMISPLMHKCRNFRIRKGLTFRIWM